MTMPLSTPPMLLPVTRRIAVDFCASTAACPTSFSERRSNTVSAIVKRPLGPIVTTPCATALTLQSRIATSSLPFTAMAVEVVLALAENAHRAMFTLWQSMISSIASPSPPSTWRKSTSSMSMFAASSARKTVPWPCSSMIAPRLSPVMRTFDVVSFTAPSIRWTPATRQMHPPVSSGRLSIAAWIESPISTVTVQQQSQSLLSGVRQSSITAVNTPPAAVTIASRQKW